MHYCNFTSWGSNQRREKIRILTLICMKYFCNVNVDPWSMLTVKKYTQLIRHNDFCLTLFKLVYYLARKTLKSNSLFRTFVCFFRKRHHTAPHLNKFEIRTFGKISNLPFTWKVSKYGVFSGPYFPVFRLNTEIYSTNLRN